MWGRLSDSWSLDQIRSWLTIIQNTAAYLQQHGWKWKEPRCCNTSVKVQNLLDEGGVHLFTLTLTLTPWDLQRDKQKPLSANHKELMKRLKIEWAQIPPQPFERWIKFFRKPHVKVVGGISVYIDQCRLWNDNFCKLHYTYTRTHFFPFHLLSFNLYLFFLFPTLPKII